MSSRAMSTQSNKSRPYVVSWISRVIDQVKRRVAVVPSVNATVNAMKEIGVDITHDHK